MNEKKTIELQVDLVNAILSYLGTRPYQEVAQYINGIQQSAQSVANHNVLMEESKEEKKK